MVENVGTVANRHATKQHALYTKSCYKTGVSGTPKLEINLVWDCMNAAATRKSRAKISGGPMMGIALYTDEVPVIKGTSEFGFE